MAHTQKITKVGKNDFQVEVDGELVGFTSTMIDAKALANGHIYDLCQLEARAVVNAASVVAVVPDRAAVVAELAAAQIACADNARWLKAANKAVTELAKGGWAYNGRVLVAKSRRTSAQYRATAQGCSCPAAAKSTPCWHRAAARLVEKAVAQQPIIQAM